jgi:hypothetical protein
MYWSLVSTGVVSGLCLALTKYLYDRRVEKRKRRHRGDSPVLPAATESGHRPARERIDDEQRVAEAVATGDIAIMGELLPDIPDPVLRHRLLNRVVAGYYRLRAESKHRAAFYRVANLQIEDADSILEGIEETGGPRPKSIEAFRAMAIALDEDGHQDAAIAICELALSLGLHDGTKAGFKGRIAKLRKRRRRLDLVHPETTIH